jgi:hypothetical protein
MTSMLLLVAFLTAGVVISLRCGLALLRGVQSRRWPSTRGNVMSAKRTESTTSDNDVVVTIKAEYKYSVKGRTYRSRTIRLGTPPFLSPNEGMAGKLRRGQIVEVFYDPKRPSICTLERDWSPFALFGLTIGVALLALGIRILVAVV